MVKKKYGRSRRMRIIKVNYLLKVSKRSLKWLNPDHLSYKCIKRDINKLELELIELTLRKNGSSLMFENHKVRCYKKVELEPGNYMEYLAFSDESRSNIIEFVLVNKRLTITQDYSVLYHPTKDATSLKEISEIDEVEFVMGSIYFNLDKSNFHLLQVLQLAITQIEAGNTILEQVCGNCRYLRNDCILNFPCDCEKMEGMNGRKMFQDAIAGTDNSYLYIYTPDKMSCPMWKANE